MYMNPDERTEGRGGTGRDGRAGARGPQHQSTIGLMRGLGDIRATGPADQKKNEKTNSSNYSKISGSALQARPLLPVVTFLEQNCASFRATHQLTYTFPTSA